MRVTKAHSLCRAALKGLHCGKRAWHARHEVERIALLSCMHAVCCCAAAAAAKYGTAHCGPPHACRSVTVLLSA